MNETKRPYLAIVWGQDSSRPGERTLVIAEDLDDAERQLKQKYGGDIEPLQTTA